MTISRPLVGVVAIRRKWIKLLILALFVAFSIFCSHNTNGKKNIRNIRTAPSDLKQTPLELRPVFNE